MNTPESLFERVSAILDDYTPPLQKRQSSSTAAEYAGTREVMQGRKKVDGHYFASLQVKPRDLRFYFFPVYTHADSYPDIPAKLQKCLKGKSCFHLKNIEERDLKDLAEMIEHGVNLYKQHELI